MTFCGSAAKLILVSLICAVLTGCETRTEQRAADLAAQTRPFKDRPIADLAKALNRVPRSSITGSDGSRRYTFTLEQSTVAGPVEAAL